MITEVSSNVSKTSSEPSLEIIAEPKQLSNGAKSLCGVWIKSFGFSLSPFNVIVLAVVVLILSLYVRAYSISTTELANSVRLWADLGMNFSLSVLGFLIAGFTIFATITKPALFIRMAQKTCDDFKINYFHYIFFTFLRVFAEFLAFYGLCLAIKMLAAPSGILSSFVMRIDSDAFDPKRTLACVGLIGVGTFFVYVLLETKSFIWNIYTVLIMSIRWEWANDPALQNRADN
jgi:hypothetical protein